MGPALGRQVSHRTPWKISAYSPLARTEPATLTARKAGEWPFYKLGTFAPPTKSEFCGQRSREK